MTPEYCDYCGTILDPRDYRDYDTHICDECANDEEDYQLNSIDWDAYFSES